MDSDPPSCYDRGFFNTGLIELGDRPPDTQPRTLIVSGIARGGTSMIAKLLVTAGVFMGERYDQVVFEDIDIAVCLRSPNRKALRRIITSRNAAHPVWGFKRPQLRELLQPRELAMFRSPRLILVLRDPVAVAQRNVVSMYATARAELHSAVAALDAQVRLATAAPCPTLLISYEKALLFPSRFVPRLMAFCGLATSADALTKVIDAEAQDYRMTTHLRPEGRVESVSRGVLSGWCRLPASAEPVALELLVDGVKVREFVADLRRADLPGPHGFAQKLHGLRLSSNSAVSVRLAGRGLELTGSGRTLGALEGAKGRDHA